MDSQEPVAVYTTNDPTSAELMRNALHEEGLVAEISGERQGGFSGVLSEIQVLVRAIDAERARAIIEGLEEHLGEETTEDDEA